METVKITKINEYEVFGVDNEGMELLVTKFHRLDNLKVGDMVEGFILNDEENEDDFYMEAVEISNIKFN